MLKDSLIKIFDRDLEKLKSEILQFDDESDLWLTAGDVRNSPGNLCLHICGNLKHFIGHIIGETNYRREREQEFLLKNVSKSELLNNCDETISVVKQTLEKINENSFHNKYPINVFSEEMTNEFFLIHLATHLNYHLGQINYQRRLMLI